MGKHEMPDKSRKYPHQVMHVVCHLMLEIVPGLASILIYEYFVRSATGVPHEAVVWMVTNVQI